MLEIFFFYLLAGIIVIGGILVVSLRNLFHCALSLLLTLLGIAGIYILLSAEFVAAVQVLIYCGGVVVLLLFAIVLTERIKGKGIRQVNKQVFLSLLSVILLFLIISSVIVKTNFPVSKMQIVADSTSRIGEILLKNYILPFELASVLILVGIIGAIIFIKERK
jgi:NADH-quinone oxidoreductase subunit J